MSASHGPRRLVAALGLLAGLAGIAAVTAGAVALISGRPLRALIADTALTSGSGSGSGSGSASRPRPAGRDGALADTATTDGLYRVHADPLVSYVLKADTDRTVRSARVRGDALGFRARPLPERGPEALHIVVAGDSVAFGIGLDDDETLANRLELELDATLAPDARPVECRTVALPGWNHRNSVNAVLDHLDALAPDIVVYLPIVNDLFDSDGVDEAGRRREAPDPAAADPWLLVSQTTNPHVILDAQERLRAAGRDASSALTGPQATTADISAESSRRYDENAASIELLWRTLTGRGGHLLVAQYLDEGYALHLRRRFSDRGLPIDVVPLFATLPKSLALPDDPHPNAQAAAAMARWIAVELLRLGWVTGAVREVPRGDDAIEALRAERRTPIENEGLSAHLRHAQWLRLHPVIDLPSGEGCNQIYGGIQRDLSAGPHALFLLPRAASVLVRVAPIESRPDLYPLRVRVELDGRPVGAIEVPARGEVEARFAVPSEETGSGPPLSRDPLTGAVVTPIEVRLVAERHVVTRVHGVNVLAAFRPLRLEARAE